MHAQRKQAGKQAKPVADSYTVRDLRQVRALGDPRKLRILQSFAAGPRTTTAVAAQLGEPVTALYRHVNALHRLGLLEVVAEQRKRGTVERTFRAVARRFEVADEVFAGADNRRDAVRRVFREAEHGVMAAHAAEPGKTAGDEGAFAAAMKISGSPAEIARLRREILRLADRLASARGAKRAGSGSATAGAMLVFYPILPEAESPAATTRRRSPRPRT